MLLGLLTSSCTADNVLYSTQVLPAGSSLIQGTYTLTMQTDCNLVLYTSTGTVWATGTTNKGSGCYLTLQSDGNLIVYDKNNKALWASNTARSSGNFVLILQPDRNLVIYGGAIWSSKTTP
ncbi:hypothetical protein LUZ60_010504 [Juncus effusus]|nr:hypothetical protein LUZ60_010504 [Juncus effusus]